MQGCEKNLLYYGDNLEIMHKFIDDEVVDLCYIDPPFNSKRNYNQIYTNQGNEDRAQSQAFMDTWTWDEEAQAGFEEILYGEGSTYTHQTVALIDGLSHVLRHNSMFAYIVYMTQRIQEIWRVLKPTGSFYLHCDPTMSHYLKLVLDSIFCPRGGKFLNEIVWYYRRWSSLSHSFQKMHDIIFFYSKGEANTFNSIFIESTEGQKNKHQKGWDRNTTLYKGIRKPNLIIYDKKKVETAILEGKLNLEEFETIKYVDVKKTISPDVWEIPILNSQAKERLGWPTQKPEKLLERIILASSNEGDTIFDAFCGCGTTVAVAERLKRQWIGADITYQAISVILKRLVDTYGEEILENIEVKGIPRDIESARALAENKNDRTRKEFEKWAILTYSNNRAIINEKKGKDYGIDGIAYVFGGGNRGKLLFSVKSGNVNSAQIRDFRGTIEREKAVGGVFITLKKPTKDMREEATKAGVIDESFSTKKHNKIEIVTVQEILDGAQLNMPVFDVIKSAKRHEKEQGTQLKFV